MAVAPEARVAQPAPEAAETAEQLFQENSGWIYGYCLRVLRSPEEAEDAVQTTFLNACRSLNQGTKPRVGSAWLLRIAQNVCLARLRASGRRSMLERTQDAGVLEETVAAPEPPREDLVGLTDALVRMPRQQRRAILLREWQGLSYSEVADQLGLTQSAVETLIFRARRSLAAELEEPGKQRRRRSLRAFDLGGLAAAAKGLFAGSAGVKTVAAVALATATTATVVATDPVHVWRDGHAPARASAPARSHGSQAAQPVTRRPALAADLTVSGPATDRAGHSDGGAARTERKAERGRPFGQATAAAAKAKPKGGQAHGNGAANRNANGRVNAPGQVKKENAAAGGKGGGPPAHAPAKGAEKSKKA